MDRQKVLAGVAVVLVAAIIVSVVYVIVRSPHPGCELEGSAPKAQLGSLNNISSSDYKTLVNFVGYLDYGLGEKSKTFMPLELHSVRNEYKDTSAGKFTLEMNCATLGFSWSKDEKATRVNKIEVDLVVPHDDHKSCTITDSQITSNVGSHYVCRKADNPKRYYCMSNKSGESKIVATLVATDLEFEINGDTEKIKEGKFSTKEFPCV